MNHESGSALQQASFALLVLIAAGLGYLIVRDRIRSQLVEERSMRRFIDGLRAQTFVQRHPIPSLPAAVPTEEPAN